MSCLVIQHDSGLYLLRQSLSQRDSHVAMLNLSHILPPNSTSQNRPDSDIVSTSSAHTLCPKALIGRIPASTPLHLAIAHQLGEKRWKGHVKQRDSGVDDLTGPIGVVGTEQKDQVGTLCSIRF